MWWERTSQPTALSIASPADVEYIDSYDQNKEYYANRDFTYIPIPSDWRYYDIENELLNNLTDEQFIDPRAHVFEVMEQLEKFPFLLVHKRFYQKEEKIEQIGTKIEKIREKRIELRDKIDRRRESTNNKQNYTWVDNYLGKKDYTLYKLKKSLKQTYQDEKKLKQERFGLKSLFPTDYGIITPADLNRREVRECIYPHLAEFEQALARKIRQQYPDSEEILNDSSLRSQIRSDSIGRWYNAQMDDIEVHIVEYINLIGISRVIQQSGDEFIDECGFPSKSQVNKRVGSINNLRNKIMHTNRDLVSSQKEIKKIYNRTKLAHEHAKKLQ